MFNRVLFKKRILFVGIPDMAYIGLDGLLMAGVNIVGVMGPKKDHNMFYDFKQFVLSRRLNYIDYDELDEPQLIETIRALEIDAAVVCSFNYKIPKILLESVKDGFINVHPSMLPKYRGGNPYSRVIMNGETETGVTIHFMDESFDTVYIALVNSAHYSYAKQALLAGKHVIVEKPLVSSYAEARELSDIASEQNVFLFEAIMLRYSANYASIVKNLEKVGEISLILANYSQYSSRYDAYLEGKVYPFHSHYRTHFLPLTTLNCRLLSSLRFATF